MTQSEGDEVLKRADQIVWEHLNGSDGYDAKLAALQERKRVGQRVRRRFVTRGGELVEVSPVPVRETR